MKALIFIQLIFILTISSFSQNSRIITGKVVDEQGYDLPGVNIIVENTTRGVVTDLKGNYKIEISSSDEFLVFSFVGMKSHRVKIGSKTIINVTMKADDLKLEELVAIGYGVQHKKTLVGAVSGVRTKRGVRVRGYSPAMCVADQSWNTEGYSSISENGFKDVMTSPLSTFSIDVDNASYANVRRFINAGQLPPADAVRIEEMINYFTYDYPEPQGDQPFSVSTELSECPWNKNHSLLHIGLKGKSIDTDELPASNLVFLLDVSGSMNSPNKLGLVKKAFKLLVNELRPSDKVSIVVYAGAAGLVLKPTQGNQKSKILNAMDNLEAGGSTAGGAGILLAYKTAKEHFIKGGNNRIILATDGDFNVGVSSNAEMEDLVERERDNGIFLTVLGFGQGNLKDDKMETIADKGNGNYAYIDNFQEARKVFINEFGGTLFTIAKDVKFQLEFNPQKVKSYRLVGYENRLLNNEDFNDDTKDAGEMGSGHTVTALYEIVPQSDDCEGPSVDPLKYQSNSIDLRGKEAKELLTIKVRYKDPDGNKSKLLEKVVDDKLLRSTSNDFRFSAAVASFGMQIRNSEHKGNLGMKQIVEMARGAKGEDEEGYRAEFINLVKTAMHLETAQIEE